MIAEIADASQIAAARRAALALAQERGLDAAKCGRVALVATEMATNLLKHAGRGEIAISTIADHDGAGIELLSLDKGPGIADLGRALADGFSTAGSPGSGLGAIRRQSDEFAIWSQPGLGTAIMARFRAGTAGPVCLGAVSEPYPGETLNGDCWVVASGPAGPVLMMADGVGHGALAAFAAAEAAKTFKEHAGHDNGQLMAAIHRALAPTRGATVAVARIDRRQRLVRYSGIGNIAGALIEGGSTRRMVSQNGTAGHIAPDIREFTYPWTSNPTIILHSDGLSAKWDLANYPGLAVAHPSLIAGILFRDFRRARDDASIAVMQVKA